MSSNERTAAATSPRPALSSPGAGEAPGWQRALSALALAAAALGGTWAAYGAAALQAGLVFDDVPVLVENPLARWPVDAVGLWTTPWFGPAARWATQGVSRPLTTLTFAVEDGLGLSVMARHLVQLGLCAAVAALLGALTTRLARAWRLPALAAAAAGVAAAGIFATAPIHTEVAMVLSYRPEALAALLALTAAHAAWGGATAAAWAALALALLAKESALAALAPLTLLALLAPGRELAARWRLVGGLWAVGVGWALLRWQTLPAPVVTAKDNPLWDADVVTRLRAGVYLVADAAWRLVDPARLAPDYSFDALPLAAPPLPLLALGGLLIVGVAVVAVRSVWHLASGGLRSAPALAATAPGHGALALGLLTLAAAWAPVSQLVVPATLVTADRLLFAPTLGLCGLLGAGVGGAVAGAQRALWAQRDGVRGVGGGPALALAPRLLAALLALAGTLALAAVSAQATAVVAADHRSEALLFQRGVRLQPRSVKMRYNLARLAVAAPALGVAPWPHIAAALAIAPDDRSHLALALQIAGSDAAGCARSADLRARLFALAPRAAEREIGLRHAVGCGAFAEAWERVKALPRPRPAEVELGVLAAVAAGDEPGARAFLRGLGADLDAARWLAVAVHAERRAGRPLAALRRLQALPGQDPGVRREIDAVCAELRGRGGGGALPAVCGRGGAGW